MEGRENEIAKCQGSDWQDLDVLLSWAEVLSSSRKGKCSSLERQEGRSVSSREHGLTEMIFMRARAERTGKTTARPLLIY